MSKPIVVELTKDTNGYPKGAELGYDSEAKARKVLGESFKVVRYQSGDPYDAPKARQDAPSAAKDGKKG